MSKEKAKVHINNVSKMIGSKRIKYEYKRTEKVCL